MVQLREEVVVLRGANGELVHAGLNGEVEGTAGGFVKIVTEFALREDTCPNEEGPHQLNYLDDGIVAVGVEVQDGLEAFEYLAAYSTHPMQGNSRRHLMDYSRDEAVLERERRVVLAKVARLHYRLEQPPCQLPVLLESPLH